MACPFRPVGKSASRLMCLADCSAVLFQPAARITFKSDGVWVSGRVDMSGALLMMDLYHTSFTRCVHRMSRRL